MKALTICQPYAHLIVEGDKRVENRTWVTSHRGDMLIHAGKSRSWLDDDTPTDGMAFGAIVGVAKLVACIHINAVAGDLLNASLSWVRDHEHTQGPWCWVLDDVRKFAQPIPYRGSQMLFDVPDEIVRGVI